jgi:hypothetical protein
MPELEESLDEELTRLVGEVEKLARGLPPAVRKELLKRIGKDLSRAKNSVSAYNGLRVPTSILRFDLKKGKLFRVAVNDEHLKAFRPDEKRKRVCIVDFSKIAPTANLPEELEFFRKATLEGPFSIIHSAQLPYRSFPDFRRFIPLSDGKHGLWVIVDVEKEFGVIPKFEEFKYSAFRRRLRTLASLIHARNPKWLEHGLGVMAGTVGLVTLLRDKVKQGGEEGQVIQQHLREKEGIPPEKIDLHLYAKREGALLHGLWKLSLLDEHREKDDFELEKAGIDLRKEIEGGRALIGQMFIHDHPHIGHVHDYIFERWDGKGPFGLKERDIPLWGRIAGLAKGFAIYLERAKNKPRTLEYALKNVVAESGKRYDPFLVRVFVQHFPELLERQIGVLEDENKALKLEEKQGKEPFYQPAVEKQLGFLRRLQAEASRKRFASMQKRFLERVR